MYTACKYVVMRQKLDSDFVENLYVFPARVVHSSVAQGLKGRPVGAGFLKKDKEGNIHCVGESDSLGVASRPRDTMLLRAMFL